jgi:aspartate ammonia-lyase
MKVKKETLKRLRLFQKLGSGPLETLCGLLEEKNISKGEYLFRQSTPRQAMYIVKAGKVEIIRGTGDNTVQIALISEGSFVGERAVLDEAPHTSSCRALEDTSVYVLTQKALNVFFEKEPSGGHILLKEIAKGIAHRLEYVSLGYRNGSGDYWSSGNMRTEHDLLGERDIPEDAYFGVQTLRALENFHITGIPLSHFPTLIRALAMVKKAAAKANQKLGLLDENLASAICQACDEIIAGNLHNQFVVDMIQGGAGTSTNMNANEVIANRALEILGHNKGEYEICHPNNHVNLSQSTNDAYPTALKLAILLS